MSLSRVQTVVSLFLITFFLFFSALQHVSAQVSIATTTLTISICGDAIVNPGEECDIPSDSGDYSTTILGRQCTDECDWAPYCGDAVLQTIFDEECDDGNNVSLDFCSDICKEEKADAGGGTTGGGGSSSGGGKDNKLGGTQVSLQGEAYPNTSVHILIDGDEVGTVRANSRGEFVFTTVTDPGTTSFSLWALDSRSTRSTTFNTTFDVTQGAVTNVNGILIPPTIRASIVTVNPGDPVTLSGQTVPSVTVEIKTDNDPKTITTTSDTSGNWTLNFDTKRLTLDTHLVKPRFIKGTGTLKTESTYGTALSLFVGVEGKVSSNSDLNRDGKVNLVDFSILVFWWGTPGGNSNPPADINSNAKVGLEDFSILLFNWTG